MTRETKIGLLVGLAFIIVIGILLSDHMTTTNDPRVAALTDAAGNVRGGVASPIEQKSGIDAMVTTPPPVSPRLPVRTQSELSGAAKQPEVSIINITPGTPGHDPVVIQETSPGDASDATGTGSGVAQNGDAVDPATGAAGPLQQFAHQHNEELIPVGPGPVIPAPVKPADTTPKNMAAANGFREYKAQEGDTLSKIAGRFMGANTKTNRDAIVKANPTLQQNPNMLVIGRTYLIPGAPASPAAAAPTPPAPVVPVVAQPQPAPVVPHNTTPAAPSLSPGQAWYTVKDHDSLWKIAVEQLGSSNPVAAVKEIQDLNPDTLKGGVSVRANMRLRLPAKSVASTN